MHPRLSNVPDQNTSCRNMQEKRMHAIMFAVAADTVNMELNGHVAQIIANKGILYERENSYDQMILAGTKADRVEHGQRSRDMFRRNIGGMFFPEENRGTGKICFTQGQGEKDPESGQYPDIDTGELEQILKDMPFDEIVFKEFSEECLNAMLEKLTHLNPEANFSTLSGLAIAY